ncbi:hypothetical protein GCM10011348_38040 [Marinobacterium nitratireducens]|uniref:Uncharacterized protein n=1 Tax=Marinobacterium nitratireducens TaxID=518897 RepID=A0A917ZP74_9GAMM|nr:hypothetical protein [Marinobacterium nitratireducens]GGO86674.1 hypothetical protein GCM10011348_38040 [Marinobacterium nitratireducens]
MDQQISLSMGGDLANLHGLGWIATDLNQLIVLSDLLESGQEDVAAHFFGNDARPFNRYKTFASAPQRRPSQVSQRDDGTLELVISELGVAAAILIPLVQSAIERQFEGAEQPLQFQLGTRDPGLKRVMQAYDRGDFGSGAEGLNTLMFVLKELNHEVPYLATSAPVIEHAVRKYSRRIARTLRKSQPQ